MKHLIVLDDNTKAGASLLEIARNVAKLHKSVEITQQSDAIEDAILGQMIEEGRQSGLANKEKVLAKLGLK
ncbi:MAG TPA: hypothetical protein PK509_12270 [Catalimonadaceae bacterium]|jgi:hypothetical protein|nr:hypothetical protein [Catalimonadaceae bacterium]